MITPELKAAIARAEVLRGDAVVQRGTAFLIAQGFALTAFHVVANGLRADGKASLRGLRCSATQELRA